MTEMKGYISKNSKKDRVSKVQVVFLKKTATKIYLKQKTFAVLTNVLIAPCGQVRRSEILNYLLAARGFHMMHCRPSKRNISYDICVYSPFQKALLY